MAIVTVTSMSKRTKKKRQKHCRHITKRVQNESLKNVWKEFEVGEEELAIQ